MRKIWLILTLLTALVPFGVNAQYKAVSAGGCHCMVLKTDGTAWGFGFNQYGQLGDGTTTQRYKPVMAMSNVKEVSAGDMHTLVLKNDGSVWAFGYNCSGQIGDGTTTNRAVPVKVLDGIRHIAAGFLSSIWFAV